MVQKANSDWSPKGNTTVLQHFSERRLAEKYSQRNSRRRLQYRQSASTPYFNITLNMNCETSCTRICTRLTAPLGFGTYWNTVVIRLRYNKKYFHVSSLIISSLTGTLLTWAPCWKIYHLSLPFRHDPVKRYDIPATYQ